MLKLTGQLVFAPDRGDGFRKVGKLKTLILELDNCRGLSFYCQHLLVNQYGPFCATASPMFGMHVTVVRGFGDKFESERVAHASGQRLTAEVDPLNLQRTPWAKGVTPAFWYLSVKKGPLEDLRQRLGVKAAAGMTYHPHLTVCRENKNFIHMDPKFVQSTSSSEVLMRAKQCLSLIPGKKPSHLATKEYEHGNAQLSEDLEAFIASFRWHPRTGKQLLDLLASHIIVPEHGAHQKSWERAIINVFITNELTS